MDTDHAAGDNPWGLEPLLDVGELAGYLRVPVYDWRTRIAPDCGREVTR